MQQAVTRHITAALTRGGDEATNWAQRYVAIHGAASQWPAKTQTDTPRRICTAQTSPSSTTICPLSEVTTYGVVGSTAATTNVNGPDRASNLQAAVDENRISIVVTATVRGHSGDVVGTRSRRLTLRIFDAPPFAVVTGAQDTAATNGAIAATQGDTGGFDDLRAARRKQPESLDPTAYRDTLIHVRMLCANSRENNNQTNAFQDNNIPGDNGAPWGVRGRAFEAPCAPTYSPSPNNSPPPGSEKAEGNDYNMTTYGINRSWANESPPTASWR